MQKEAPSSGSEGWSQSAETRLLEAVTAKNVVRIRVLLRRNNLAHCASHAILNQAFMQVVTCPSDESISVLKCLLNEGVTAVSCGSLYSVLSLLRLVSMDTLNLLNDVVCNNTDSYDLRGCFLQAMVHFKQLNLVENLVNSGMDLKAFWDDKFDMRDSSMCATEHDAFMRTRLLPPDVAAIFIKAANDDETLQLILKNILEYTDVDKKSVHNLLVLLVTAGYKPNSQELKTIETKYKATAQWYASIKDLKLPDKMTEGRSKLNMIREINGIPAQLKALLLLEM